MTFTTLVIAGLAVWEILEIWRHGSIFATVRARVDLWEGFFGQLIRCPFCLAPWVSLLVILAFEARDAAGPGWPRLAATAVCLPLFALAVARLANVLNDLTRAWNRTPKSELPPAQDEPKLELDSPHE